MVIKNSIFIQCPICSKVKRIEVPKDIFKYECAGLLYLKIQKQKICEHAFYAILDQCLSVRDYADFEDIPNVVKDAMVVTH